MIDAWGWGPFDIGSGIVRLVTETTMDPDIPQAELNPFGTLFTVVSWMVLMGLNLWCFLRLLAGGRRSGEGLSEPVATQPKLF